MGIELLLNHLGIAGTLGVAAAVAAPLGAVGQWLRRTGRRRGRRWQQIEDVVVAVGQIRPGRVAVAGRLRRAGSDERALALVEASGQGALIEPPAQELPVDGSEVLVVGYAMRQAEDPRQLTYRDAGRLWVVQGDGADEAVEMIPGGLSRVGRERRRARRREQAGGLLLAVAVALGAGALTICYQAGMG